MFDFLHLSPSKNYDRDFDSSRSFSNIVHAIGGVLAGLGTQFAIGCTLEQGICELARLSKRSFAAICTFMCWTMLNTIVCYGLPDVDVLTTFLLTF
jgi:uncharacterized membrane protein YedE/YeeE